MTQDIDNPAHRAEDASGADGAPRRAKKPWRKPVIITPSRLNSASKHPDLSEFTNHSFFGKVTNAGFKFGS